MRTISAPTYIPISNMETSTTQENGSIDEQLSANHPIVSVNNALQDYAASIEGNSLDINQQHTRAVPEGRYTKLNLSRG